MNPDLPRSGHLLPRVAARLSVLVLRTIPRRTRFAAIKLVVRFVTFLLYGRGTHHGTRFRLDTPLEQTLVRAIDVLSRYGLAFDPVVHVDGEEVLETAFAQGRGVLMVGPHRMLLTLLPRYMVDREKPALFFAAYALPVAGSNRLARMVRPSAAALFSAVTTLRGGGIVCALIDRRPRADGTPAKIAGSLLHLATRVGSGVVFMTAGLSSRGDVVFTFRTPSAAARTADAVAGEFEAFVLGESARGSGLAAVCHCRIGRCG